MLRRAGGYFGELPSAPRNPPRAWMSCLLPDLPPTQPPDLPVDLRPQRLRLIAGGRRFVELLSDKPERRASGAVPRAAKANRPLFYADAARKRKALTVAEVHGRLDTMIAQRVARYASIRRGLAPVAMAAR